MYNIIYITLHNSFCIARASHCVSMYFHETKEIVTRKAKYNMFNELCGN